MLQHELVEARRELQQARVELQRKREAVTALQEAHEEVGSKNGRVAGVCVCECCCLLCVCSTAFVRRLEASLTYTCIQVAERYAHVVGQQGEELTLLRTAAKEAEEAREQKAALEQTGGCC